MTTPAKVLTEAIPSRTSSTLTGSLLLIRSVCVRSPRRPGCCVTTPPVPGEPVCLSVRVYAYLHLMNPTSGPVAPRAPGRFFIRSPCLSQSRPALTQTSSTPRQPFPGHEPPACASSTPSATAIRVCYVTIHVSQRLADNRRFHPPYAVTPNAAPRHRTPTHLYPRYNDPTLTTPVRVDKSRRRHLAVIFIPRYTQHRTLVFVSSHGCGEKSCRMLFK